MGEIICIANQKGGVGKTTTTINIAAIAAQLGKRVLLVDLDPQANAISGLSDAISNEMPTVYAALINHTTAAASILTNSISNLFVLPS
ncbi:MAG TPA: AAA family ATPase, partial [bacterium]|nr:AAA family ATPase [bacterium]